MTAKNEKFAVIETGGKQYLVKPGSVVRVERIGKPGKGDTVHFDKVLLSADKDKIKLGNPYLKDAKISGKWVKKLNTVTKNNATNKKFILPNIVKNLDKGS